MRLNKRLKTMNDRNSEKDVEILELKKKLREVKEENEKLKVELEMHLSGEQHLNVNKWSERNCFKYSNM